MWFLRRKTAVPEASGEALPPAVTPMRRIEITVERHSVTRLSRSNGAEPSETAETQSALPAPPDG
jgi:hypothetical protein